MLNQKSISIVRMIEHEFYSPNLNNTKHKKILVFKFIYLWFFCIDNAIYNLFFLF